MISYNFRFSMKTLNLIILFWVFILCLLFSCKRPKKDIPVPVSWSSNDPLSIPFRIRLQKFQRANLIENSSFETGKTFVVDTTGTTFRIDGWQKVGDNVEWVNVVLDTIFNADEAVDSLHSIKIHRVSIDETDEVVDGIIRGLESGQEDIEPGAISYFQSIADEELDVPGLEVPEKED